MSFFKRLFGTQHQPWLEFARQQLRVRIQCHPLAKSFGLAPDEVDSLSQDQLLGAPDTTIIVIAKTYGELKSAGHTNSVIFDTIESHRNKFNRADAMPDNPSLFEYIKYRVRAEHPHGLSISDNEIYRSTVQACEFFSITLEGIGELPSDKVSPTNLSDIDWTKNVDELLARRGTEIIKGYRAISRERHCAPDSQMSDEEILAIYRMIYLVFRVNAVKRQEILTMPVVNNIVFFFLQKFALIKNSDLFLEHVTYEAQKHLKHGLREEYRKPLLLY